MIAVVLLPILGALLWAIRPLRASMVRLGPWLAVPAVALALFAPEPATLELGWLFMETRLGLDQVGRVFLLLTAVLWAVAGFVAQATVRDPARFFGPLLLCMAGNLGLCVAQDLLSFYLFFALMSFSAYPLVIHEGHAEAWRAGRVYLALVVGSELAVFAGAVLAAGGLENPMLEEVSATNAAAVLLIVGFGVKAGMLPLHVWLPLAHPVAPTPASAVLSGAMIKAGLLGWLRVLPLGEAAAGVLGPALVGLGIAAAFYGVLIGLTQRDPKTLLAYSSISQMGAMTVLVGLGLLDPALWPGALAAVLIYALHHGLAKGALFLSVGVSRRAWTGRGRWLVVAGLVFPALAMAGMPWTSGAVAKTTLKLAVEPAPGIWVTPLTWLLSIAALGTTLLMIRFLWLVWPSESHARARVGEVVPWALLLGVLASVLWWLPWEGLRGTVWAATTLVPAWGDVWPPLAGVLVAAVVIWRTRRAGPWEAPPIPRGDLLVPVERFFDVGEDQMVRSLRALESGWNRSRERLGSAMDRVRAHMVRLADSAEEEARTSGAAFVVFGLVVVALWMVGVWT